MSSPASRLLGLDQTSADVYPLLDWKLVIRFGGFLWLVGAVTAGAVLPFASPTHVVGRAGWVLVAASSLVAIITGMYMLLRPNAVGPLALLLMGYAAAAGLGVGQALIGPQAQLELAFLLLAAYHASIHPARRVLALLGWIVVAEAASTLIGGPTAVDVVQMVCAVVLLVLMTVMAIGLAQSHRSRAKQLISLREQAERRALTDTLTGLANRRAFDEELARQVASSGRHGRPLSLIMLDVDDFKSINDRFGHDAGDAALIAVANAIIDVVRRADICFRWGGDEFVVLLPEVLRDGAAVAQRISDAIRHGACTPGDEHLAIGWGTATLRVGERPMKLLERADARLLAAKRASATSPLKPAAA